MDVRLNQPGQHVSAARVDHPIVPTVRIDAADRLDAPIANRDVTSHDLQSIVHGEDACQSALAVKLAFKIQISDFRLLIAKWIQ